MSSSQAQPVISRGIFHGLPTFPDKPEYKNLTAIITGANGISGQHMIRALAQSPERWSKIYALSRKPPPDYLMKKLGKRYEMVKHIALDFFTKPEEMGKVLKENGVKGDYIFYFAYTQPKQAEGQVQWSNAQEISDANEEMLVGFMKACDVADIKPKRFMLQTGAKQYGSHMGPVLVPQFENDPRVGGEPNFYYPQEDRLFEYCSRHGAQWNVVRPSFIMGAVGDSQINYLYGLGIYASIQAHLKQPLRYPASLESWTNISGQSSAFMNAYLEEWAVLDPKAGNQAFNAEDGSYFTWGRFWPLLAKWFGTDYTTPELDKSKYKSIPLALETPPRGFGPQASFSSSSSIVEWATKPETLQAWKELSKKYNLNPNISPFDDPDKTFGLCDSCLQWEWGIQLSMNKARKMGFHGYADSYESAFHVFEEFAEFGLCPPMVAKGYEPAY